MDIKINGIYRHYKGNKYKVIAIGKHSETLEQLVVYQALYGNNEIWCRPISMWNDDINIDGKIHKRFQIIEDNNG
jgi:hypothetical protein